MTKTLPTWMFSVPAVDDLDRPLDDVISRIEKLNEGRIGKTEKIGR